MEEGKRDWPLPWTSSHLCKYLEETFPVHSHNVEETKGTEMRFGGKTIPISSEFSARVASHFWAEFKVYARSEGNLFQFKYDQGLCDSLDNQAIRECRGIILKRGKKRWNVLARPFNKFFNQNEGASPVKDDPQFNRVCAQFAFTEKVDGSCIQLWYNQDEQEQEIKLIDTNDVSKWWISTLGTITPDTWVPELFWKFFARNNLSLLDPNCTYLFELCCEQNKVVTAYETDKLFLIGARETQSGRHFTRDELDSLAISISVTRPKFFTFEKLGIVTLKQAKQWVEDQALLSGYGKNPEGFVVYWKDTPLCKLKNLSYVQKHGIVTGSLLNVRNIVIERYFGETLDDVSDVLTHPAILQFLDELKEKVRVMLEEVDNIRKQLLPILTSSQDQKSYVKIVQDNIPIEFRTFFMQYKDVICNPNNSTVGAQTAQHIKKNYFKWKKHWKDSKVVELIEADRGMTG